MKKKAKKILTKYTHIDTGINKKSLLTSCISTCMLYLRWYLWQRKIRRQQFNFFHRQCVFIWARRQSNEKNSEEFCRKRVEIATILNKWKKEKKMSAWQLVQHKQRTEKRQWFARRTMKKITRWTIKWFVFFRVYIYLFHFFVRWAALWFLCQRIFIVSVTFRFTFIYSFSCLFFVLLCTYIMLLRIFFCFAIYSVFTVAFFSFFSCFFFI